MSWLERFLRAKRTKEEQAVAAQESAQSLSKTQEKEETDFLIRWIREQVKPLFDTWERLGLDNILNDIRDHIWPEAPIEASYSLFEGENQVVNPSSLADLQRVTSIVVSGQICGVSTHIEHYLDGDEDTSQTTFPVFSIELIKNRGIISVRSSLSPEMEVKTQAGETKRELQRALDEALTEKYITNGRLPNIKDYSRVSLSGAGFAPFPTIDPSVQKKVDEALGIIKIREYRSKAKQ